MWSGSRKCRYSVDLVDGKRRRHPPCLERANCALTCPSISCSRALTSSALPGEASLEPDDDEGAAGSPPSAAGRAPSCALGGIGTPTRLSRSTSIDDFT
eukprot:1513416-Pleurochrysis_carterae.AAC.2